jgi:hypothetical protein
MQIVLPGALPASPPIAAELAKHLPSAAPTLTAWLQAANALVAHFDPHEHGCTPYEGWCLLQAGFRPSTGQQLGAGLGPLRAGSATVVGDGEPVWVADLAHVALGTDRASLIPAAALDLTAEEGAALFEAARPLFDDTEFRAEALRPHRWRVHIPADMALPSASPEAVTGQTLNNWWPQQASARPWRRMMNEIQMVWYAHPVNEARMARGQLPINGLWLYGGAAAWTHAVPTQPLPQVLDTLQTPCVAEDWAAWLDAVAVLDSQTLKPLADDAGAPRQALSLLLLGRERSVRLSLKPRSPLLRWLPSPNKDWRAWWSHPA